MVKKEMEKTSKLGTTTWNYNDVETGERVYWVSLIHSGTSDSSYVRFGKVGGDEFTKVFHFPRLAYQAFVEIQKTMDDRLIQRGELDLSEIEENGGARMNKCERVKMVKAMEFIARQINDECLFEAWLIAGVADGDIEYGDLIVTPHDEEYLNYYIEDKEFAFLMRCFLDRMHMALRNGGLCCDGILSEHLSRD